MSEEFVTVQEIAERWGLDINERLALLEKEAAPDLAQLGDTTERADRLRATLQRQAAYDVVHDEVNRFKGPAPHPNRSRTRGVLGLSAKQFEKASAKRVAFDVAEAAKPAPTPARRPVTKAEFEKIKAAAIANGFLDLRVIGQAWGMKWAKTLEYMHFLDPTVKDTVQLIQGSIERMNIPQEERRGLYQDEFDRLTEIGEKREAKQRAERNARRDRVDAEVERLEDEKDRYERAKVAAFEEWDDRLKAAKVPIEELWVEYYSKAQVSRDKRDGFIQLARTACSEAVDPLKLKLKSDIYDLGEEPPEGPRFSKESEIWWVHQHAKTALSRVYGNEVGVYEDSKREAVEDARSNHRQAVWQWRKELYAAIEPLKETAYEIFKEGSVPVDKSQFDLKSRV